MNWKSRIKSPRRSSVKRGRPDALAPSLLCIAIKPPAQLNAALLNAGPYNISLVLIHELSGMLNTDVQVVVFGYALSPYTASKTLHLHCVDAHKGIHQKLNASLINF